MSSLSNSPSINVTSPSASSTVSSSSLDAKITSSTFKDTNQHTTFNLNSTSGLKSCSSSNKIQINSSTSTSSTTCNSANSSSFSSSTNDISNQNLNSNCNTHDSLTLKNSAVKRDSTCDKCKNHHQVKQIKDHKINCPYKDCNCGRCLFTVIRRRVTSANQRKRRQKLGAHEKDIFDHERIYERLRVLDLLTWDLDIMIKEPSKGYCKIDDDDILNLWSILQKYLIQGVTLFKSSSIRGDMNRNCSVANGHHTNPSPASNSENINCNSTAAATTVANSTASTHSDEHYTLEATKLQNVSPRPPSTCSSPSSSAVQQQQQSQSSSSTSSALHQPHLHSDTVTSETYNGFKLTPKMQCKSSLRVNSSSSTSSSSSSAITSSSCKVPSSQTLEQTDDTSNMINSNSVQSNLDTSGPGLLKEASVQLNHFNTDGDKRKNKNSCRSPNGECSSSSLKHEYKRKSSNSSSPGLCASLKCENLRGHETSSSPSSADHATTDDDNINVKVPSVANDLTGHKLSSQFIMDTNSFSVNLLAGSGDQINDTSNFNHSLFSPFEKITFYPSVSTTTVPVLSSSCSSSSSSSSSSSPSYKSPLIRENESRIITSTGGTSIYPSPGSDLLSFHQHNTHPAVAAAAAAAAAAAVAGSIFNPIDGTRNSCSLRSATVSSNGRTFLPSSMPSLLTNHIYSAHPHGHSNAGPAYFTNNYHPSNHHQSSTAALLAATHPSLNSHRMHPYAYHPYSVAAAAATTAHLTAHHHHHHQAHHQSTGFPHVTAHHKLPRVAPPPPPPPPPLPPPPPQSLDIGRSVSIQSVPMTTGAGPPVSSSSSCTPSPPVSCASFTSASLVNNPFLPDSLKSMYLSRGEACNVSLPMQPLSQDELRYNRSLLPTYSVEKFSHSSNTPSSSPVVTSSASSLNMNGVANCHVTNANSNQLANHNLSNNNKNKNNNHVIIDNNIHHNLNHSNDNKSIRSTTPATSEAYTSKSQSTSKSDTDLLKFNNSINSNNNVNNNTAAVYSKYHEAIVNHNDISQINSSSMSSSTPSPPPPPSSSPLSPSHASTSSAQQSSHSVTFISPSSLTSPLNVP